VARRGASASQHPAGRARPNARRRGPRAAGSMSRRTPAHGEKRSPSWCPTPRASRPRILGRRPPPGRGNAPAPQSHARTRRQVSATDQAGTGGASRLRTRPPGGSGIWPPAAGGRESDGAEEWGIYAGGGCLARLGRARRGEASLQVLGGFWCDLKWVGRGGTGDGGKCWGEEGGSWEWNRWKLCERASERGREEAVEWKSTAQWSGSETRLQRGSWWFATLLPRSPPPPVLAVACVASSSCFVCLFRSDFCKTLAPQWCFFSQYFSPSLVAGLPRKF
jgi:hypothetical protein